MHELYYAKVLEWKELGSLPEKQDGIRVLKELQWQSRQKIWPEKDQTLSADAIVTSLSAFSGSACLQSLCCYEL